MTAGYPIQLKLKGRLCVVVGGGQVGLRKIEGLLRAGAQVRLITESPVPEIPHNKQLEIFQRPYREGDLKNAFLAFAATNSRPCNAAVTAEARRRKVPINVADDRLASDFFLPATLVRGDLAITVSTDGHSPALAVQLRNQLAEIIGPEWETVLAIVTAMRRKRLTLLQKTEYNCDVLRRLVEGELPALVAENDSEGIDKLLGEILGEGITLADLEIHLPKGMT